MLSTFILGTRLWSTGSKHAQARNFAVMTGVNSGLAVAVRRWGKGKVDETYGTCAGPFRAALGLRQKERQVADSEMRMVELLSAGGCSKGGYIAFACSPRDSLRHHRRTGPRRACRYESCYVYAGGDLLTCTHTKRRDTGSCDRLPGCV